VTDVTRALWKTSSSGAVMPRFGGSDGARSASLDLRDPSTTPGAVENPLPAMG